MSSNLGKIMDSNAFQLSCQDAIDSKNLESAPVKNPPPKRGPPLQSVLQITITTDFFNMMRPRFGGSKADRI
jgi:hypothetical protein